MNNILAIAITWSDQISLGNLITIALTFAAVLSAYYDLREKSKTNRYLLGELKNRMNRCGIEEIKEKVAIMWLFQLRRGLVEAELKGLMTKDEQDDQLQTHK